MKAAIQTIAILLLMFAIACAPSCSSKNETRRAFIKSIYVNYPDAERSEDGQYINASITPDTYLFYYPLNRKNKAEWVYLHSSSHAEFTQMVKWLDELKVAYQVTREGDMYVVYYHDLCIPELQATDSATLAQN